MITPPSAGFAWLNLAAAALAAGIWYLWPAAGGWPLLLGLSPWLLARRLPPRSPGHAPLLLFVLTAAGSVWAAYDRPVAWSKFWLIIGGWLLFVALLALIRAGLATQAVWLIATFGAAVALYFLSTNDWSRYPVKMTGLAALGQTWQSWLPALPGHRLHPNVAGGVLAMGVPFAAAAAWHAGSRQARGTGAALLLLTLVGLLFTASRGAWAAVAAAALLAVGWRLAGRFSRQVGERRWLIWGGSCGSATLLLAALLLTPALPAAESALSRLALYRDSFFLAADYPLLGAGLGSFPLLYSSYSLLVHVAHTVHAHNLWLNVAIEQGLFGVLALVWLIWLVGTALWRVPTARLSAPLAAGTLALVTILVHGMVDDAFYGSRALLLLFAPLAFALADSPPAPAGVLPAFRRVNRRWTLALLFLLLALLPWQRSLQALVWRNLAAVQQSQAELTLYRWPDWPLQDAVRRAVDLSQPVASYERALSLDPASASANRRLGQIELSLGRYPSALAHLQAAYLAAPTHNATRQLLGEAYIAAGQPAAGTALWQHVNNKQGQLALRAFWYESLGDAQRLTWIRQAASASSR